MLPAIVELDGGTAGLDILSDVVPGVDAVSYTHLDVYKRQMFEVIVAKEGMEFLGWRKVPVCPEVLGQKALSKMPNIQQAFVKRPGDAARGLEFDRRLYVALSLIHI